MQNCVFFMIDFFQKGFMLLVLFLFLSFNSFALENNNIVGLLVTKKETYEYEIPKESERLTQILTNLGAKIIKIDYNELINQTTETTTIDKVVEDFINTQMITKVLIPGNYYNIDLPPHTPTENRQIVTKVLTELARNKQIYLMGICGGMQGILHAQGIKIVNIAKIETKGNTVDHFQQYPLTDPSTLKLNRIRINPLSNLASMISPYDLEEDKNGWISVYLPHIHSEGIDSTDTANIDKLLTLGYNIIGFADDGIIEIVEDANGNVHFLSHPEILLSYKDQINFSDPMQKKSLPAMEAVIKAFINKK